METTLNSQTQMIVKIKKFLKYYNERLNRLEQNNLSQEKEILNLMFSLDGNKKVLYALKEERHNNGNNSNGNHSELTTNLITPNPILKKQFSSLINLNYLNFNNPINIYNPLTPSRNLGNTSKLTKLENSFILSSATSGMQSKRSYYDKGEFNQTPKINTSNFAMPQGLNRKQISYINIPNNLNLTQKVSIDIEKSELSANRKENKNDELILNKLKMNLSTKNSSKKFDVPISKKIKSNNDISGLKKTNSKNNLSKSKLNSTTNSQKIIPIPTNNTERSINSLNTKKINQTPNKINERSFKTEQSKQRITRKISELNNKVLKVQEQKVSKTSSPSPSSKSYRFEPKKKNNLSNSMSGQIGVNRLILNSEYYINSPQSTSFNEGNQKKSFNCLKSKKNLLHDRNYSDLQSINIDLYSPSEHLDTFKKDKDLIDSKSFERNEKINKFINCKTHKNIFELVFQFLTNKENNLFVSKNANGKSHSSSSSLTKDKINLKNISKQMRLFFLDYEIKRLYALLHKKEENALDMGLRIDLEILNHKIDKLKALRDSNV